MNLAAENTLLNFRAIGKDVLPEASAQIANLATAMANTRGRTVASAEDMTAAAKLLGKGLQDPATGMNALTRVGVKFTAEQTKQIKEIEKTSGVAAAQKQMMEDLAGVVGGKAAASAQTFQGKLAIVQKTIVEDTIPAIQGLYTILGDLGSIILSVAIWFGNTATTINAAMQPVYNFFAQYILPVLQQIWNMVGQLLVDAWNNLISAVQSIMKTLAPFKQQLEIIGMDCSGDCLGNKFWCSIQ